MQDSKNNASVIIRIILWIAMLLGGSIYSLCRDWNTPLFSNVGFHIVSIVIGLGLLKLSFKIASISGKELAKGRVGDDIPRLHTNKLVTTGVYGCMRHPMFFGLILLPLSLAFILGSPTFILVVAPFEIFFIIIMAATVEEREAIGKFGGDYVEYKRKVPFFSFEIKCLKKLIGGKNDNTKII